MKRFVALVGLFAWAVWCAPVANAAMLIGNYEVQTNRWASTHAWTWSVSYCGPDCMAVVGTPRPLRMGVEFLANAYLTGSTYTLVNDAPDGVICWGYTLPARDVYTWDANTLAGTVVSTFDAGCNGAPGGVNSWTFALNRM